MDQFEIVSKIGEGAYSSVFTVKRIEDDQLYALKKVKIQGLSLKEKENALNEIRILASVNSPYVISYKESFIDEKDQTLCIVMEYADEGDLFQKITLYKQLHADFSEDDVWKIFIQITKGLNDLHEINILHRDLKSANVFLFRDGTAKLGDLNVSKITSRGLGCTQTGTPYYASPEVWKDKPYDLKSDIWSLGCLCYEMLMLKTPFRAQTMEGLYKKVMKGKYPEISKKYSNKFDFVISNMLKLKPEERPTTNEILNYPEIVEKIEELGVFIPTEKQIEHSRIQSGKSSSRINNSINNSYNSINNSSDKLKRNMSLASKNEKSVYFTENNMSINVNEQDKSSIINNFGKSNISAVMSEKLSKSEVVNVLNNNLNYFNQKKYGGKKAVLDTIRLPKNLIKLNDNKLPASQYDTDIIKKNKQIRMFSFPNKVLPLLKVRYNTNDENNSKLKENYKSGNLKGNNNKKTIELSPPTLLKSEKNLMNENNKIILNRNNKSLLERNRYYFNKYNTLKMKIDKDKPFNYKGEIDIIVEE